MTKLEHALALAGGKGFRVFPLEPNGKKPAIKNWVSLATTDPATICRWWSENQDYNIGVATGQGLVVIDYDMKPGQQGAKGLAMHEMLGLPTDGFRVITPSGGLHLYFRTSRKIPNSVGKVHPNVDIRGEGGYVVGPGSTIGGTAYEDRDAG